MAAAAVEAAVEAKAAEHRKFLASVGGETNGRRGVVDLSIAGRYALGTRADRASCLNRTGVCRARRCGRGNRCGDDRHRGSSRCQQGCQGIDFIRMVDLLQWLA